MSRKMRDENEPIGKVTIVRDFLPLPSQLAPRKKNVRVTLELTEDSVQFFKAQANRNHGTYQGMIRTLVDEYASHYRQDAAPPSNP